MSEKKERRRNRKNRRNNWVNLRYPGYYQNYHHPVVSPYSYQHPVVSPYGYQHPVVSPYGYGLTEHSPYLYSQPVVPYIPPPTSSCGCMTCDLPPVGRHLKGGLTGVCMGNVNKCKPGDDRCWCHDTCDPLINPHGSGWWNCSNSSTGGQGVPTHSTCNRIPGLVRKY